MKKLSAASLEIYLMKFNIRFCFSPPLKMILGVGIYFLKAHWNPPWGSQTDWSESRICECQYFGCELKWAIRDEEHRTRTGNSNIRWWSHDYKLFLFVLLQTVFVYLFYFFFTCFGISSLFLLFFSPLSRSDLQMHTQTYKHIYKHTNAAHTHRMIKFKITFVYSDWFPA